jgi:hypothetical protein
MPPASSAHQSAGGPCSDAVMASSHGSEETRAGGNGSRCSWGRFLPVDAVKLS